MLTGLGWARAGAPDPAADEQGILKRVSAAVDDLRAAKLVATKALTMAIQEYGDDYTAAKFDVAWDQFGSKILDGSREQFRNSLRTRLRRAKLWGF